MNIDNLTAIQILSNPSIKEVFKVILNSRILSRYEIETKEDLPKEDLEDALDKLENAGLIEKRSSTVEEFDKFYPTGSGLTVEKMLK
jgi:predicted transcriptional regulator